MQATPAMSVVRPPATRAPAQAGRAWPHPRPRVSPAGLLLLGALLLWAQAWLATHELEHLFHHDDEPCVTCALAGGLSGPPPAVTAAAAPPVDATATRPTAPAGPARPAPYSSQQPRAPPPPLH
jgi:hypothetical protein